MQLSKTIAIEENVLKALYEALSEYHDGNVVCQNQDWNVLTPLPYGSDYGRYLKESFIDIEGYLVTDRLTNAKSRVSLDDFVRYIKSNKLHDKDGQVKGKHINEIVELWR